MAQNTGGRIRAVIFLLISLIAAVVASAVIFSVIRNFQEELVEAERPEETVPVIVAAHDIHQGKTIATEDLKITELPPEYVPDAVLRQPEEAIERVPRERILANEFIREERLACPKCGQGLTAIIPKGMRAFQLNVSGGSAVSGFINPGNYVDILVTIGGDERDLETITMLQAVTVLAVDARMGAGARDESTATDEKGQQKSRKAVSGKPSVTLAVTPEQAEKLTYANEEGRVVLTLRNDIDVTQVETNGAQTDTLLGGANADVIEIKEWFEQRSRSDDGTLIIIKGDKDTKTK